jgi:hypothetical protein
MQSERDEARSSLSTKNERTTTLASRGLSARLTRSTWFGIKRRTAGTSCLYRGKTIYRFATFLGIQIESLIIDSWSYPSYPSYQDVRPLDHVCPCVCVPAIGPPRSPTKVMIGFSVGKATRSEDSAGSFGSNGCIPPLDYKDGISPVSCSSTQTWRSDNIQSRRQYENACSGPNYPAWRCLCVCMPHS